MNASKYKFPLDLLTNFLNNKIYNIKNEYQNYIMNQLIIKKITIKYFFTDDDIFFICYFEIIFRKKKKNKIYDI